MGRLSSIIFVLPSSMAAGWVVGYYLVDRYLSIFPWGSIILTMVGAGAGLYEIIKILNVDRKSNGDQS
jgi:F0F1-type ATP synthase assembly protein I